MLQWREWFYKRLRHYMAQVREGMGPARVATTASTASSAGGAGGGAGAAAASSTAAPAVVAFTGKRQFSWLFEPPLKYKANLPHVSHRRPQSHLTMPRTKQALQLGSSDQAASRLAPAELYRGVGAHKLVWARSHDARSSCCSLSRLGKPPAKAGPLDASQTKREKQKRCWCFKTTYAMNSSTNASRSLSSLSCGSAVAATTPLSNKSRGDGSGPCDSTLQSAKSALKDTSVNCTSSKRSVRRPSTEY